jgi:hypothetical protein
MRNEIYARHGLIFKRNDVISYFSQQSWYQGKYENVSSMLTSVEQQNIEIISNYEGHE